MPSCSIPGPTQFARTPYRPSSTASARTIASRAALGADDSASRTGNRAVAAVVTATMLPSASRSAGSAGRTTLKNAPASSASCSVIAAGSTLLRWTIGTCGPAAWTSVCTPPCRSMTSATTAAHASGSVASSWCVLTRPP